MKAKLMVAAMVAAFVGMVLSSPPAMSKPEFAKKEGKPCTNCHVKAGKPDLNDIGKCYKEKKSLDDCK